ncbi:MAG: hypothetical protein QOD75_3789 [Blastocatellia bacterium]|jgi:hypothetical protein|nr:hypothetical protein [Blastocatellia bacterium]
MAQKRELSDAVRRKLVHLLIAKSIAESLLVASIAVIFFLTLFPPYFRGWGEATPNAIAGWAVNEAAPAERVEVQLFIDGRFAASDNAGLSRPDVRAAGWSDDDWHGYSFTPPSLSPGEHEAQVYALHSNGAGTRRTLQLLGDPIRFVVDSNGVFQQVK